MNTELIGLIANLALALSFIVGLVFGILQVKAAASDRKERLTLDALRNFQTREFSEIMFYTNSYQIPSTYEKWQQLPANDQIMFLQFTQQMESLGILVAEKFINIDLVDKILGSFVTTSWENLKTVMYDIREKRSDPFLCEYFQWLAERLTKRMEMNPRKPFHSIKNNQQKLKCTTKQLSQNKTNLH